MKFAHWLFDCREKHGFSQRELARMTEGEITASAIHRLETGDRLPGVTTLRGLAIAFGVSFEIDRHGRLWVGQTELKLG